MAGRRKLRRNCPVKIEGIHASAQTFIGVDYARGSGDSTVLTRMHRTAEGALHIDAEVRRWSNSRLARARSFLAATAKPSPVDVVVPRGLEAAFERLNAGTTASDEHVARESQRMRDAIDLFRDGIPHVDLGVWLVTMDDAWPVDPERGVCVRPPRGRVDMETARNLPVPRRLEARPWRQRLAHADYRWSVVAADGTTADRVFEFGEALVEHREWMRRASPPPGPWCMHDDCVRHPALAKACLQRT